MTPESKIEWSLSPADSAGFLQNFKIIKIHFPLFSTFRFQFSIYPLSSSTLRPTKNCRIRGIDPVFTSDHSTMTVAVTENAPACVPVIVRVIVKLPSA